MTRPDISTKRFSQMVRPELERVGLAVKKIDNLHVLDKFSGILPVTMTVCPLYAPGKLSESQLIEPPLQISDSRVHTKWETAQKAAEVMQRIGQIYGFTPSFEFSFADKGVITGETKQPVETLLDYHYSLYQAALSGVMEGYDFRLQRYSQLDISLNQTIQTNTGQDQLTSVELTEELKSRGVEFRADMLEKGKLLPRGEKMIRKLITQIGSSQLALELMTQYGLYDSQTAQPKSVNIYIERESAGLLLQITDLFAHSHYPRIDLMS